MRTSAGASRAALAALSMATAAACGRPEPLNEGATLPDVSPIGDAAVHVQATTVAPESEVPVHAQGFAPETMVEIGLGMPASDYSVVRDMRTDPQGQASTSITIPRWAMRGQSYVIVVSAPDHTARAVSEPFVVGTAGDTVRVQGTLEQGVECPAIRVPGGALFTLATRDLPHPIGTNVQVVGTIAEVSFCMQGTTLAVVSMERR